jgi:hypothetical protein
MRSPARYSYGNARMHALKNDLWPTADLSADPSAPWLQPVAGDYDALYPPLMRWYATLQRGYPTARRLLRALCQRHEIENLKLLWRCATRGRAVPPACWRPLSPLASIERPAATLSLAALVEHLASGPYGPLASLIWRSHGADLLAAELAFDGWCHNELYDASRELPREEASARQLVAWLLWERDLDLLARAVGSFGLAPTFAANLTILMRQECSASALAAFAAGDPQAAPIGGLLPRTLRAIAGSARDLDAARLAMRRHRLRACRTAMGAYPFQIAPALGALMLREDQLQLSLRRAAAQRAAGLASRAQPTGPGE